MVERGTAVAMETGKSWHAADMPIRLVLVRKLETRVAMDTDEFPNEIT